MKPDSPRLCLSPTASNEHHAIIKDFTSTFVEETQYPPPPNP